MEVKEIKKRKRKFRPSLYLLANVLREIEYQQCIPDERFLHLLVDMLAGVKARRMVHFQNVRLHLGVDENVHAEDLKAGLNHVVRGKTCVVVVLQHRQRAQNCLDDDIVDVRPKFRHVVAFSCEDPIQRGNLALRSDLVVGRVHSAVLVNRVVGEVHEHVAGVVVGWLAIFTRRKSVGAQVNN